MLETAVKGKCELVLYGIIQRTNKMQLWQYCLLVTARLLYMFRSFLRPSSGVLETVVAATGACHCSGNWPRTSLLDIFHPDPWHYGNLRPPRILRTLIFKGGFWIYFCSAYFTHHRIVHLPVIYVLIDYKLLNRQWYIQCIHYDYNKFNYW